MDTDKPHTNNTNTHTHHNNPHNHDDDDAQVVDPGLAQHLTHAMANHHDLDTQHNGAVVSQVSDLPALAHGEEPFPSFPGPYTHAEEHPEFASASASPMQSGDVSMHDHHLHGDDGGLANAMQQAQQRGQARRSGSASRLSIVLGEDGKPIPEGDRPAQGTEEWNQMRRINHKEVERKRRETINEGIGMLSALVQKEYSQPERNKGAILRKAAQYIEKLKNNETNLTERYTLDKLLSDQTIADLQSKLEKTKQECERAWREVDIWKRAAAEAGVKPDEVDVMASIEFPH